MNRNADEFRYHNQRYPSEASCFDLLLCRFLYRFLYLVLCLVQVHHGFEAATSADSAGSAPGAAVEVRYEGVPYFNSMGTSIRDR